MNDIVDQAHSQRQEKWAELIGMLYEADGLQQELLGDVDSAACYEFHNQLNIMASEFESWAEEEEREYKEKTVDNA